MRSTNTGISALIDPAGRIYQRRGQWTREILTGEVSLVRSGASPPYQALGDLLGWICLALLAIGWVASTRARRAAARVTAAAGGRTARHR